MVQLTPGGRLDGPIDPWGSIPTTLRTTAIDELFTVELWDKGITLAYSVDILAFSAKQVAFNKVFKPVDGCFNI